MMRVSRTLAALTVLAAASLSPARAGGAGEKKPWTPADIHRLKRIGDNQVSPDGKWIAFTVSVTDFEENGGNSDIWLIPSEGGEPKKMTTSPEGDGHPRWSPDGTEIAFISSRDGSSQIYILPVGGGESRKVADIHGGVGDFIWTHDGNGFVFTADTYLGCEDFECVKEKDEAKEECETSAMVHESLMYRHWDTYDDGKVQHLFHMTAGGEDIRDLTPELKYDALTYWLASAGRDFDLSPDGATIYFSGKQDEDQAVSYNEEVWKVDLAGGEVEKVTVNPAADTHPRVSPDGRYLAWRATERPGYESDRYRLTVMELPAGEPRSLTPDFDRSVGSFFWEHDGDGLYFSAEDEADIDLFHVSLKGGEVRKVVGGDGEAGHGYHLSVDPGPKDRFFTYLYRPMQHYYEIFRCDGEGGRVRKLTGVNDEIYAGYHFPDAEEVWFEGAGGTMVHGFVVKPMDFDESKEYPMLVRIHGGPQQMFGYAYRTEYALFSGAGYAVFFCNPRGSTGYGQEFTDGIRGDWGGKVIEDIRSGVRHVLDEHEWIDEHRVGAWGGSFGGFVCNWLQGHNEDGMFSVLVSHAGEAEQWCSYGSTEELWFAEWEFYGPPWENPELNDEYSPIRYAKNFSTPHLIIHGELDYRVPITGGETMFTALQRLGVPSKMIRYPDEDHWILQPHNQRFWYASILDWFEQWLRRGGEEAVIEKCYGD